ncbi:MAG: ABC-type transport auxiliary lipoprotein family protein [Pseudomonadota bacterium]
MGRIGYGETPFAAEGNRTLNGNLPPASRLLPTLFRSVFGPAVLSVLCLLSGCAIWTENVVSRHIIDYPTPKRHSESPIPDTIMVYRFLLADTVDTRHLIVTSTDEEDRKVTMQQWESDPSDMVTELVQRDLEASRLFKKTVDQWSSAGYRYALEGTIKKLEGVVKNGKASAVLNVDAALIDFESPLGARKNILAKNYVIEVPSEDPKPVSIFRAVNMAVRKLSEQIRTDIAAALMQEAHGNDGFEKPYTVDDRRASLLPCRCGMAGMVRNEEKAEKSCSFQSPLVVFCESDFPGNLFARNTLGRAASGESRNIETGLVSVESLLSLFASRGRRSSDGLELLPSAHRHG